MFRHHKRSAEVFYQTLVKEISSHAPIEQRSAVERVLETNEAKNTYRILHQHLPEEIIPSLMASGIEDFAQGKNLSPHKYVSVVAEELKRLGHYDSVIGEMHHRHMLSDKEYSRIMTTLKEHTDKRVHGLKGLEDLVRKVAVFISFISGVVLILTTNTTVTGAVVGTASIDIFRPFIGSILLLFSLLLFRRS